MRPCKLTTSGAHLLRPATRVRHGGPGILVWLVTGPLFGFSDTWQLVINTGTTIVTFLMVFLIQNTQNRDTEAMQLKLDELIRATEGAHNALLDLEELEEEELDAFKKKYQAWRRLARPTARPLGPVQAHGVLRQGARATARRSSELMPHRRLPAPLRHRSLGCNALHLAA